MLRKATLRLLTSASHVKCYVAGRPRDLGEKLKVRWYALERANNDVIYFCVLALFSTMDFQYAWHVHIAYDSRFLFQGAVQWSVFSDSDQTGCSMCRGLAETWNGWVLLTGGLQAMLSRRPRPSGAWKVGCDFAKR